MRILLVSEDVPAPMLGGAGQHAVVLGNALIDAGHEVHLLGYRQADVEDAAEGNHGFRGPLHCLIDFRAARWQENRLGAFMPLSRPHTARRIWRAIRSLPGHWDVVHYHGHNPLLGALVPPSWNFLHTLHDQGAECIVKTRFRRGNVCREMSPQACAACATPQPNLLQTWLSVRAVEGLRRDSRVAFTRHRAVFVSRFVRDGYCEATGLAVQDIQASVVHNFVDLQRLRTAAATGSAPSASDGRQVVFAAGRIAEAKGFGALLDELNDEALRRMHLVIAGDGPGLPALQSRHQHRGVKFLGWCQPAEVLRHTLSADICVVPSLVQEACATTVLEALALGRPVLALKRGGTPELAQFGAPGQLRLFDDMRSLAAALCSSAPSTWPANDSASVEQRLPELVALYRKRAAVPIPPGTTQ